MVTSCSATNCTNSRKNTRKNVTFHRFPLSRPKLCKQWVRAISQQGFDPAPHHLLCSDHFEKNCFLPGYINRRQLKKNAVPNLFCLEKKLPEPEKEALMLVSNLREENFELSKQNEETAELENQSETVVKVEKSIEMHTDLLCRVCACANEELVPVFGDKGLELQLVEKIHTYLPIMMTPEDLLPVTLCASCIYKLEMCHEFVNGCLNADAKLREILGLEEVGEAFYSAEDIVEYRFKTATDIKQEQEINTAGEANMYEDPAEVFEDHTQESMKSQDPTDILDSAENTQIPLPVDGQNSEVEANANLNKRSADKFVFEKYTEIPSPVAEQNTEVNVKGIKEVQNVKHFSDKSDAAKHTKIMPTVIEQNTEIDVKDLNESEGDFDKNSDHLQGIEVKEESVCQQSHHHIQDAKSTAVTTKSRSSRAVRNLKIENKVPKFKVVIVKMKDAMNMTHTAKLKKALDLVMNARVKDLDSMKEQQPHEQEQLTKSESCGPENSATMLKKSSSVQPSILSIASMKPKSGPQYLAELCTPMLKKLSSVQASTGHAQSEEVKRRISASIYADHCYTNAQQSVYRCMYCGKTVTNKDSLISHQVTVHPDKVFHCEQCNTIYHSKELLDKHQKSHLKEIKHNGVVKSEILANDNLSFGPTVQVEKVDPFSCEGKSVKNMKNCETSKPGPLKSHSFDALPVPKTSEAEKGFADKNIVKEEIEDIRVLDVHIEPEKSIQKRGVIKNDSKFCIKLSKEFENIDKNDKSKILEAINKIVEKNSDYTKTGAITNESTRQKGDKLKTAKLQTKIKKVKKHKPWKCSLCNHTSTSRKKYREHFRTHPRLAFSCSYCDKPFLSQKSLDQHVYIHHTDEKNFICECCGKRFRYMYSLKYHLFVHKKAESLFQCDKCGREFGSKTSYDSHCSSHGDASYLCDICGKSMKYWTSLRIHRMSHVDPANLPQHRCVICEKTFRSRYFLGNHMRLHTNERPYECSQCGKKFRMGTQLSTHRLIHTNARQHKCPVCGKGFNRRHHMRAHVRTHQRQPLTYTCKLCKNLFPSVGELILHRRTHTQEEIEEESKMRVLRGKPPLAFSCQICGKQLASKFTLKNHVMMHADDKPFSCEICGKSFAMKSTLQTHRRVHTGEKPHPCQYCGEAFLSKQNLVIHERIHTGEMPFRCTQCDKAYRSRHSLRQHLLFHADYRPFECPQCGKKFRRQDILCTHMRIHTGERPYACKVCGRAFKQKGDCNKHQQRHAL